MNLVYMKAGTVVKRLRLYQSYSHVSLAGNDTMYLQVCVCGEAQYVNDTFVVRPHGKATVNLFLTHLSNSFHTIHHRRISPPDFIFRCADQEREKAI